MFLDLIELEKSDSQTILDTLLGCMKKHGMDSDYLQEYLICFASDGASVMTGRASGIVTKLKEMFPNVVFWDCSNHKLELAVNDCVKAVGGINNFKIFMDKLYSLYSASPKNKMELQNAAQSLETELLKIGKMLDTWWVASSYRAVSAVMKSYAALAEHFKSASRDSKRDGREKTKYLGMLSYLTSKSFVLNLSLMADALQELSALSLDLQSRQMTFVRAHKRIKIVIAVFLARKYKPGKFLDEALREIEEHTTYNGVLISENSRTTVPIIDAPQFYQALADNLTTRLYTTVSRTGNRNVDANENLYNALVKDLQVLIPENWPAEFDALFGEDAILNMCKRFQLPGEHHDIISGFREFKLELGRITPKSLQPLIRSSETLIVSTAECERAFSSMNKILTDTRNKLKVARVSALMFAKIVGPPLSAFKPMPYVRSWILSGRRCADNVSCKRRSKSTNEQTDYTHLEACL